MSEKINPDYPTFPFQCQGPTTGPEFYYGLPIRAHFASMAMHGFVVRGICGDLGKLAQMSVNSADELIRELNT